MGLAFSLMHDPEAFPTRKDILDQDLTKVLSTTETVTQSAGEDVKSNLQKFQQDPISYINHIESGHLAQEGNKHSRIAVSLMLMTSGHRVHPDQ